MSRIRGVHVSSKSNLDIVYVPVFLHVTLDRFMSFIYLFKD